MALIGHIPKYPATALAKIQGRETMAEVCCVGDVLFHVLYLDRPEFQESPE